MLTNSIEYIFIIQASVARDIFNFWRIILWTVSLIYFIPLIKIKLKEFSIKPKNKLIHNAMLCYHRQIDICSLIFDKKRKHLLYVLVLVNYLFIRSFTKQGMGVLYSGDSRRLDFLECCWRKLEVGVNKMNLYYKRFLSGWGTFQVLENVPAFVMNARVVVYNKYI